jgi:site-specific DNA recombinase
MDNPFETGDYVAAYLRDSGGDEQDLSTEQQERAITTWCNKNGLVLSNVFIDKASPGSSVIGRDSFQRMIKHFHDRDCVEVGIIIWKFSRFARDMDDSQFYKADLRRRGYIVFSINDPIPEGSSGRFFEAAVDWMNQRFLEDLSSDVKRGLQHLVGTTGGIPGTPPKGFKREAIDLGKRRDGQPHIVHRWAPDPETWELCRLAWHMRASGASYLEITTATGLFKCKNSWFHFFENRIYIGELRYGSLVIPGYVNPMIDQATWSTVQETNRQGKVQNRDNSHHPRRMASNYVLSGLVRCARCGSPLNGDRIKPKTKNANRYYVCSLRKRTGECRAPIIPQAVLEKIVIDVVVSDVIDPVNLAAAQEELIRERAGQDNFSLLQREQLNRQLQELRRKINNLTGAIAELGHSRSMLDNLQELEGQEANTMASIAKLDDDGRNRQDRLSLEQLGKLSEQLRAVLNSDDRAFTRRVLFGLIDHIIIERQGKTLTGKIAYYLPGLSIGQSHRRESNP